MKKKFAGAVVQKQSQEDQFITRWCDTVIARSHSMIQKVKQVADHQALNDLSSVSFRGKEGSGKTTLSLLFAHMLHKEFEKFAKRTLSKTDEYLNKQIMSARKGYIVKVLTREDLMRFSEVLREMPKVNRILVFDDLSFISGNLNEVKKQVSEVRHDADGGYDNKHVLMYNFHYSKSFDKYLRDTHFVIQTSGSSEELKNITELLGSTKSARKMAGKFIASHNTFSKDGKINLQLSKPGSIPRRSITYQYSNPFRLALFYDSDSPKFMVYPGSGQRGSADPLGVQKCVICNPTKKTSVDVDLVTDWMNDTFGKISMETALKNMSIIRYGHDAIHSRANVALECIKRLEHNGIVNYDDLLVKYTKKDKKVIVNYMRKGTAVKKEIRESFALKFGHDGLKATKDQELKQSDIEGTDIGV